MRRKARRRDLAEVREYVASQHEAILQPYMDMDVPGNPTAERSRAWVAAVRAGEPVLVHWYELPEGTLPLPALPGGPCDYLVITSEGTIVPDDEYKASRAQS